MSSRVQVYLSFSDSFKQTLPSFSLTSIVVYIIRLLILRILLRYCNPSYRLGLLKSTIKSIHIPAASNMSPLQPVALFGLEVPPGDILVPVSQNFPATVSITSSLATCISVLYLSA